MLHGVDISELIFSVEGFLSTYPFFLWYFGATNQHPVLCLALACLNQLLFRSEHCPNPYVPGHKAEYLEGIRTRGQRGVNKTVQPPKK